MKNVIILLSIFCSISSMASCPDGKVIRMNSTADGDLVVHLDSGQTAVLVKTYGTYAADTLMLGLAYTNESEVRFSSCAGEVKDYSKNNDFGPKTYFRSSGVSIEKTSSAK